MMAPGQLRYVAHATTPPVRHGTAVWFIVPGALGRSPASPRWAGNEQCFWITYDLLTIPVAYLERNGFLLDSDEGGIPLESKSSNS
jgi:hypothetical protein